MAAFNPQLPQSPAPNFTYSSRGVGTSNTFKTLFGGVASLGQDYLNARDNQNKTDIYNQTVAGRDQAAAPYVGALGGAGYLNGPDGGGGPKGGPGPGTTSEGAPASPNVPTNQGPLTLNGDTPQPAAGWMSAFAKGGGNAGPAPPPGTPGTQGNAGVDPTTTGAIAAANTTPGVPQPAADQPLPPAISQGADTLASYTKAMEAGTISKPYYDLQILNLSKDLHTRFPGYGQQIDATIQSVTGIDPTNALVNDSISISQANAVSAKTAETEWNSFTTNAGNQDALGAMYPDIYTNPKYNDPSVRAQVKTGVLQFNSVQASYVADKAKNEASILAGTMDEDHMVKSGLNFASTLDQNAFRSADSIGGISKQLDAFAKDPDHADPKVVSQMIQTAGNIRAQQLAAAQSWLDQKNPDGSTNTSFIKNQANIDRIMKAATANTDAIIDALKNKDYGMANYYANNMKIQTEGGANLAFTQSSWIRAQNIAKAADPSNTLTTIMSDQTLPAYKDPIAKAVGAVNDAAAATGHSGDPNVPTPSIGGTVKGLQTDSGITDKELQSTVQTHMARSVAIMSDPKTDPKTIGNEVNYWFADAAHSGNKSFLEYVPPGQRAYVYAQLTSPTMAKQIFLASKSDPEIWKTYSQWVVDEATNTLTTNFSDLQNGVQNIPNGKVSWDPNTFTVGFNGSISMAGAQAQSGLFGSLDYAYQYGQGKAAEGAVKDVNTVLANVKNIAEMEGEDPSKVAAQLIANITAAQTTAKTPSMIGGVLDTIGKGIEAAAGGGAVQAGDINRAQSKDSAADWNVTPKADGPQASAGKTVDMQTTGSVPGIQPAAFHPGLSDEYRPASPSTTIPEDQKTLAAKPATPGVSDLTVSSVKDWEESGHAKLTAYNDGFGTPTIGYGHTGPDVKPGTTITQEQADAFLKQDLSKSASAVESLVKVPLTEGQKTALTSFAFNEGEGALAKSTLLQKLNQGDYAGATQEFNKWVYARSNGHMVYVQGLQNRRDKEIAMFSGGQGGETQTALNLQGVRPSTNVEDRRGQPPDTNNGQLRMDPNIEPNHPPAGGVGGPVKQQNAPTPQQTLPAPSFLSGTERVNPDAPRNGVTKVSDTVPSKEVLQAQLKTLQDQIDGLQKLHLDASKYTSKKAEVLQQLNSVYGVKQGNKV